MGAPRRSHVVLTSVIQIAQGAPSIDQAVELLALELRSDYDLWMAAIAMFTPSGHADVVALWSAGERLIDVGTEIAITLTPGTEAVARKLLAGTAAIIDIEAVDWGLVGDVLRRENLKSFLGIPLRFDDHFGVLTLVSRRKNAFELPDLVFFTGIAAGIRARCGELLIASGRV